MGRSKINTKKRALPGSSDKWRRILRRRKSFATHIVPKDVWEMISLRCTTPKDWRSLTCVVRGLAFDPSCRQRAIERWTIHNPKESVSWFVGDIETWRLNGELHRDGDKPARIFAAGRNELFQHRKITPRW